ncbi:MAG: hypothetical protein ABW068_15370, partial [Candidatus Thiodiazotropha sp.]
MEFSIRKSVFTRTRKMFLGLSVLLVSALSCIYSVNREIDELEQSFIAKAMEIQRDVIQRVANLDTVLTALVGQHHSSDFLSSAEQTLFSQEMLKAYPFIYSILYLERVSDAELTAFEQRMHESGFVSFHLDLQNDMEAGMVRRGLGFRCQPGKAKRRLVVPGSREAILETRRAVGA